MGGSQDLIATRHRHPTRRPPGAAALLVGASILAVSHVASRGAMGPTTASAPIPAPAAQQQPTASRVAKKEPNEPRRTLEIRVVNGRSGRPEPGVAINSAGRDPARDHRHARAGIDDRRLRAG
jgi:hypothetical protein